MNHVKQKKKQELERRLAEYYQAETKILSGQSYTIGSRQLTRTSLSAVQDMIKQLEAQIEALETSGTTKRRMKRVVPMD